jgi:membrane-bound hydrogenase subunit alpha
MHEKYLLPIGPYHPAMKEPEYFKAYVRGEEIIDLDFELGYMYRGIEELAEKRSWNKVLFLVNRICGICGIAHTINFCRGVEELTDLQVPERARYIRTILSELNRIHSHLLYLGIAGYSIGFDTIFKWCWATREIVLDWLENITGGRIHYSMNTFGGVRRDINKNMTQRIGKDLKGFEEKIKEIYEIFRTDRMIDKRMARIGILQKKMAKELGIVGPTARGSDIKTDVRKQNPYAAYPDIDFKIITERSGDCKARTLVRARECLESIKIVDQALSLMPSGKINTGKLMLTRVPAGEIVALDEAPRGENVHYLVSDGGKTPKRLRIRPPTYANMISIREMSKGSKIADVPVIIESIDPCFGCCDRMTVIDVNSRKERIVEFDKLLGVEKKLVE